MSVALPTLLRPIDDRGDMRLGVGLCGWWVPASVLGPESVCYLAGAREDITFGTALMERFGCAVVSLDPTPRAIAHVCEHAPLEGYHFLPVGLGGTDRTERFHAPANPALVSQSIANLQRTSDYFGAPVQTLDT